MKNFIFFVLFAFTISLSACSIPQNSDQSNLVPATLDPIPVTSSNTAEEDEIIFHNGQILTMNRSQPTAEAIFIKGETIQAIGSNGEILSMRRPLTKVIDLGGLTLMPGIIDAHAHIFHTSANENLDASSAQSLALSYGVTTIGELAGDESLLLMLRDLGNTGQMRLRVNVYPSVYNEGCQGSVFDQDWYKAYAPGSQLAPNVRMAGVKIYTDGSGCVPPAVSYEYAGGAGHGTLFFESPEKLADVLKVYYDQGYQIAIHTIGDRAIEQVQQAIATFPTDSRDFNHFRTEHNAVVRPDLMKPFTELGIVGVLFGGYPTCIITSTTDRFAFSTPDEFLNWEWPWKSLFEANPNGHFAYSSDAFGVTSLNPFDHILSLTTRREIAEDGSFCEPPPLLEQNKISIEQALEIMTLGGAYSLTRKIKSGVLKQVNSRT